MKAVMIMKPACLQETMVKQRLKNCPSSLSPTRQNRNLSIIFYSYYCCCKDMTLCFLLLLLPFTL